MLPFDKKLRVQFLISLRPLNYSKYLIYARLVAPMSFLNDDLRQYYLGLPISTTVYKLEPHIFFTYEALRQKVKYKV